jgi:hypothetical protein
MSGNFLLSYKMITLYKYVINDNQYFTQLSKYFKQFLDNIKLSYNI